MPPARRACKEGLRLVNGSQLHEPALRLQHALWIFTRPSAVFRRVEDTAAYGWALLTLILLVTLLGYVQVQSGLIDRLVDMKIDRQLAELEKTQLELVDRRKLRDAMDEVRKQGQFIKTLTRLQVIVLSPLWMVASFLLIAAVLYAVVALTGRKPEYHTLMAICVYAGYIGLIAHVLRVAMMLTYRTIDVDTSLALLAPANKPTVLAAADPFLIWFWVLVAMGLTVTRQLTRRMAILSCVLLGLAAMGIRVGLQYAAAG